MIYKKLLYHLKRLENPPIYSKEDKIKISWAIATDGSIGITKSIRKNHQLVLSPYVCFTNTDPEFLNIFEQIIKIGHTYWRKLEKRKPEGKRCVRTFFEILHVLKSILSFLPIKKQQAKYVIRFIESRIKRGIETTTELPYSDEEIRMYEKVKELNNKKFKGIEIINAKKGSEKKK